MLLGTHTSGDEKNFLQVATVNLPNPETEIDARKFDEEKQECGGFGGVNGKVEIKIKIPHDGEVNRARYMPQNSFIVATKTPSSDVFVFDVSKHPSTPEPDAECCPEHRCTGHTEEGYGICWSPHKEGMLLSGSDDKTVCLWDIGSGGETVNSLDIRSGHTDVVEDVSWHGFSEHRFGSVGDDKQLLIWDVREGSDKTKAQSIVKDAHDGDVNSLSFCPHNEFLLVTAGGDRAVKLWDMRNLKAPQHVFEGHKKEVYVVEWCADKNCKTIMASCAADRRVNVWDISRIGQEQAPEDAEDGPPELLFIHGACALRSLTARGRTHGG